LSRSHLACPVAAAGDQARRGDLRGGELVAPTGHAFAAAPIRLGLARRMSKPADQGRRSPGLVDVGEPERPFVPIGQR
jgi:hypothetical protein